MIGVETTSDLVIPLIVLVFIVIFVSYMLYLLISSGFRVTTENDRVSTDRRTDSAVFTCPEGQCATNIMSGFKTCPLGNERLVINPAESVCNSKYVCDNPLTPFAEQSDQSTNMFGACEINTECPCLRISQCPDYILSVFTTSNGDPYRSFTDQRITFPQKTTYITGSGESSDQPPIRIPNVGTEFCTAPLSWLPLSTPGCNFVSDSNGMTYQELLICMGLISNCNNVEASPCMQGVLAFVTDQPDSIRQGNINSFQVGCVRGEPCECGEVAIYDTRYSGLLCKILEV